MWEYPPNTAFFRCLYLCFCELFESGHRTLCQNIASGQIYRKLLEANSGNLISDRLTEGFFNLLSFSVKRNSLTICYEKLLSVTLHTNFFFTNEPYVVKSYSAIDVVVSSALKHLNTMRSITVVWFSSIPTPISYFICCLVYTGFCITRPATFMPKVP